ncbi:MAG: DNA polymerase III subunit chi [Thermaurantiacus sp.]
MAEIGFYHCTRQPAIEVAVRLADKALAAGKRVLMVADPDTIDGLDRRLWTDLPETFLAHGRAGAPDAALQPILLAGPDAAGSAPANGAAFLMLVGVPLSDAVTGFERLFLLFEEGSPAQDEARKAWKALAARDDMRRSYWQQRGTSWEKAG